MRLYTALILGTVLSVLAVSAIGWLNGYPSSGVNWTGETWTSLWLTVAVIYFLCLLCIRRRLQGRQVQIPSWQPACIPIRQKLQTAQERHSHSRVLQS